MTRVLGTTTWDYFTSHLPDRFGRSPIEVKEAIMTDINNLVCEFRRTSSDGAFEAPFFEMRRLLGILQKCFDHLDVRFDIIANAVLTSKYLQPNSSFYPFKSDLDEFGAKFKTLLDGYCKMFDQSLFKSKDLGDILRFLPGIVVQNRMSMPGMADFYRIKPDLLNRLIKSTKAEAIRNRPPYVITYVSAKSGKIWA